MELKPPIYATVVPGTCPIRKIPLEVLLHIGYHLPTPDLCSLRLTCRSVEQSLYRSFVHEFFTKRQFMMTPDSLQALIDISRSRMSQHLRHVHIGLDRLPTGRNQPLLDDEKGAKLRERYSNTFMLWYAGHHRDMLAAAFRNLENLEDVVVRDFNSCQRSRDGPGAEWHSYGFTTVLNETGVLMNHGITEREYTLGYRDCSYHYCSQVFAAVLSALGSANARPKGVEVMSRNHNYLLEFAFHIPEFMQPSVLPVLERLEKLHLSIDLAWQGSSAGWYITSRMIPPNNFIQRFFSYTTNLRNLRINSDPSSYNDGFAEFFDWFIGGSDSPSQTSTSTSSTGTSTGTSTDSSNSNGNGNGKNKEHVPVPSLPYLEKLSLGFISLESRCLLKLISKFAPSLKSLELWTLCLTEGVASRKPSTRTSRTNFWAHFLDEVTEIPGLELKHFKAGRLLQRWMGRNLLTHVSSRGHRICEYTGSDWKHFVAGIKPVVVWPPEEYSSEDDG